MTVLDENWNVQSGGSAYNWNYLHQGGRFDVTSGLYHFRHRDYSPTQGRWTSLDPLRYDAGDINLYRSVFNNPLNLTDPSGQLVPLLIAGAVLVGGIGGGVIGYVSGESSSGIEDWIPGYGAGRNAGANIRKGKYWSAGGYILLAGTDVFLLRSVGKNACNAYAKEGWRAFMPGQMVLYSDRRACHCAWSITTVTRERKYYQVLQHTRPHPAVPDEHLGKLIVKETHRPGLYRDARPIFWFPCFSTGMAGAGRVHKRAWKCVTAPFTAASAGTYHIVPYTGSHMGADGIDYLFSSDGDDTGVVVEMAGADGLVVVEIPPEQIDWWFRRSADVDGLANFGPRNPMPPLDTIGKGGDPRLR